MTTYGRTGLIARKLGMTRLFNEDGSTVPVLAGFIEYRQQLYEIIGAMSDVARYRNTVETSIRSFNSLTDQRVLAMQPDRLRTYTARQGDTLRALAARYANPRVSAENLALLNRLDGAQALAVGTLVKVVEKGY